MQSHAGASEIIGPLTFPSAQKHVMGSAKNLVTSHATSPALFNRRKPKTAAVIRTHASVASPLDRLLNGDYSEVPPMTPDIGSNLMI